MSDQSPADAVFEVTPGTSPVVLAMPHTGTFVPPAIMARLNDLGQTISDTDWHVHRLYDGLLPNATKVRALFSRYVIDANRDPAGTSLYPGQNTTTLVPMIDFDNNPIWVEGQEPTEQDIAERLATFHAPYHAAVEAELQRVKAIHGIAVLFDCHSIRSHIPFLFEGTLPDLNLGTNSGTSCAPEIEAAAVAVAEASDYTNVLNGRFKGGWTTRHYGRREEGIHSIQLELAQSTHLVGEELPFDYDPAKAEKLRKTLADMLARIEAYALSVSSAA
ncbi:N-formylglutamate deformylase [Breoghania sp.]|uniref:N-formylglutamate deformylase n=1 Tax=Breoghania sp. TaxID=2065378 RepID=UPI002AA7B8F8|nr:N-formylglutamate deformylase [Breoghania sp.]